MGANFQLSLVEKRKPFKEEVEDRENLLDQGAVKDLDTEAVGDWF